MCIKSLQFVDFNRAERRARFGVAALKYVLLQKNVPIVNTVTVSFLLLLLPPKHHAASTVYKEYLGGSPLCEVSGMHCISSLVT